MRALVCAMALMLTWASSASAAPRHVVSLDYCADQFVLALADRDQIAAVSHNALRDDSYYRARARGLRQVRPTVEETLALHPDLIVRTWGGAWDAAAIYARFHVPVLQLGDAADFTQARAQLLQAAHALGHDDRGATLARDLDTRLAHLRAIAPRAAPPVMYLSAGGATPGPGVMMDAVIRAAGGRNIASAPSWNVLPLERLTQTPPALVATAFFDTGRTRVNAWSPSRHPAFRAALARTRTVPLPAAAVSCEAWTAIDAAELIATALRRT
ncbi:MAG: ABC transporter substrate-binding protein [Proteobacteria bacterium]|nr:ABC transporter substrate-binding protein [Pseudomonadota bacterium]